MNKTTSGENSNLLKDDENLGLEQPAIRDENEEAKKKQRMKCIGISVGIAVAIAILVVILVLVLKKSSSPDTPPVNTDVNPFNVIGKDQKPASHGPQNYYLQRDTAQNAADGLAVGGNSFHDKVTVKAQLMSYESARIQIYDTDNYHDTYHVPPAYFSDDYLHDFEKGLFFNHLGFQVSSNQQFYMRLYDRDTKEDFVTTQGQTFLSMKYYQQIGFKLESQRLFGFGERTRDFKLTPGTYVLYPKSNDNMVDNGDPNKPAQQNGQHPFLMAQLRDATFFGIYIANSNSQKVTITEFTEQSSSSANDVKKYSKVVFTAQGGSLDMYFFLGPTYQDVLRQYHTLIGKPILPPLMAHGLYMSNDDLYKDPTVLDKLISFVKTKGMALEGVVIPPDRVDNQYLFNLNYNGMTQIKDLHQKYPGVKWIYPFSPLVPKNYMPSSMAGKNLLLTVDGNAVEVTESVKGVGYCFDFFNYNATDFLEGIYSDAKLDFSNTGFWLYHNTPSFTTTNVTGKTFSQETNPYQSIPFWPGNKETTYAATLPPFVQSHIHYDGQNMTTQSQFYLHGLFGTEMAARMQYAASDHSRAAQALIVSESTFPGAGSRGIAHVFPKQALTTQALQYAVAQIFNFHMFGIPYASPNVCGYYRDATFTPEQQNLCVRSFQLALVSPFAVYNTNGPDISSLSPELINAVHNNLNARMSLVMYARSELYKISQVGGALVRPLFTEYGHVKEFTPNTYDTVLYGESLKVDFVFSSDIADKTVILPPYSMWLEIFNYEYIFPETSGGNTKLMTTSLNHPIVLQKEGTIIPIQNIINDQVKSTNILKNTPMRLSVLLDQSTLTAKGHVLIEDGKGEQEWYEVRATRDSITFKQQNEGSVSSDFISKNIEMIRFAAKPLTYGTEHVACAVLQDHHTVQQMYVRTFHKDQLEITPRDPNNKDDKSTLSIADVAFIYYGIGDPATFKCSQSILQGKGELVYSGDFNMEVTVSQNVEFLVSGAPRLNFGISIEDDNTLYLSWFPKTLSAEERRAKEENAKIRLGDASYKLSNIVTVNMDPFYIEVHSYVDDPSQPKTVYWTTKDTSFVFGEDYAMFTFLQPNTDGDKFFGIGERKGSFYLKDNYQYSMYTNNLNLEDIVQGSRTIQFCKNGFFPLIFAMDATNKAKMMATYLTEGSKDIFFTKRFGKSNIPKVSVIQTVNFASLRIIFDQNPMQLMRDTHRNLFTPESLRIPPAWALGQYHLVRNFADTGDMQTIVNLYKQIGWPLEGFILDLNFTEFESLRLNPDRVEGGNTDFFIQYINQKNLTLFQNMKAGIPKHTTLAKYLIGNNSAISLESFRTLDFQPVTGLDQQGEVIYANYYYNNYTLTEYTEGAFAYYERQYKQHTYGVQLIHNEIYDVFCSNDCQRDVQFDPMPDNFYKVGIDKMLRHSLSANAIKNVDTHNGYGYKQQLRLSKGDFKLQKFFVSSSNTPGSGKFGNVGRYIDYIGHSDDATVAVTALQSLSILGMGAIGEKFGAVDEKVGDQVVNQHITIQTFSPLAAHQWLQADPKSQDDIKAGPLVRYKYMLIKYTQTLLFKQALQGDPLIHPLFFDFYLDDTTFKEDLIANQYMYGDFMISIRANVKGENTYFPKSYWCSTHNFNADPFCFQSNGIQTQVSQRLFYFKQGAILTLQDAFGKEYGIVVDNTKQLVDVPLDFHISPMKSDDGSVIFSNGALLYYSDAEDVDTHCYVEIIHVNNKINFVLKVGRDLSDCHFPGYRAGKLYIYNPTIFPFKNVKVNGDEKLVAVLQPGVNEFYKYFDLFSMKSATPLNWYNIDQIEFS